MFSKSGYNENLKELIKANKADKSVVSIIKENLDIQAEAKSFIRKGEKEIKRLNATGEDKQNIKTQTSIYNFKEYMNIRKELKDIKKQLKKINNELKEYNKQKQVAEQENIEIEKEIENQYKIYKENEIYAEAFYRIDKKQTKIPEELYSSYSKHVELYNSSIYSAEKNSKLPEPKVEDFVGILEALKISESKKSTKKVTKKNVAKAQKKAK